MNRYVLSLLLVLMSPLPGVADTAFQYDLIQLNAYDGVFEVEGLDGELSVTGASLLYSRELGGQFFFYLHPGLVLLKDQAFLQDPALAGIPVDVSIQAVDVSTGLARYFTLNPSLDVYLAAGLSYSRTRVELDLPLLNLQETHRDSNWSGGIELGARAWLDAASRFEFAPYYTSGWGRDKGHLQTVGAGLGARLSPRFQLRLLLESALSDDASLGMGLGLRFYL